MPVRYAVSGSVPIQPIQASFLLISQYIRISTPSQRTNERLQSTEKILERISADHYTANGRPCPPGAILYLFSSASPANFLQLWRREKVCRRMTVWRIAFRQW